MKTLQELCQQLGFTDVREFTRRARFAGWDEARLAAELERPEGIAERFAADGERGVQTDLTRRVNRRMREFLASGPVAMATLEVDELVKRTHDPRLSALATSYDPFTMGGRLVCGPTGLGKSTAAVAVLRRHHGLVPANLTELWDPDTVLGSRLWVRAFDLPNARLSTGLGKGEAPLVDAAMKADFLVLDDIGWESKRASADDVLLEVIATRYDAGRITYASTGLRFTDFEARYGDSVVRRITQCRGIEGTAIDLWKAAGTR